MNEFSLVFSGFDLTTIQYVEFDRRMPHDLPTRTLNFGNLVRKDGRKLISTTYNEKVIVTEGHINAPTRADMEIARDTLLFRLQPNNATLDIAQATGVRRYTATMQNIIFTHVERGLMKFSVQFATSSPFGQDVLETTLELGSHTTSPKDYTFTVGGTYNAELVLAVALETVTGGSNKTISISNPASGEQISITRTWENNDSIVIHVRNRSVTVNGSVVDYNGVFPLYQPGSAALRYTDDFTTRDVTISATYYKRYL